MRLVLDPHALPGFIGFARRYWCEIYPLARREMQYWRRQANRIPDDLLRGVASATGDQEWGNYEGAAAFATLAPPETRTLVIRAVIAYQVAYDYVDSLAERSAQDPVAAGRALHTALPAAVSPRERHPEYYAHFRVQDDGGYLKHLVETCRSAVDALPSWPLVADQAQEMSRLVAEFQARNHAVPTELSRLLHEFATSAAPAQEALNWWEVAAGSASSLVVFALIASSASPSLKVHEVSKIAQAYVPWIGALHVLLDSLVDWPLDATTGHHSLVAHYASSGERAARMNLIAGNSLRATRTLPDPRQHELLVVAMAGQYLAKPTARLPHAAETTTLLTATLGDLGRPVLAVHRARNRLRPKADRN